MKKKKKQEYFCGRCKRTWLIEAPTGIVRCEVCNDIASRIIRAPKKKKQGHWRRSYDHGSDSFDPSPMNENIARAYEDEK